MADITGQTGLIKDMDGNIKFPHTVDSAVHITSASGSKTLVDMFNDTVMKSSGIADNLTTTDAKMALSANQGVAIRTELDAIQSTLSETATKAQTNYTNISALTTSLDTKVDKESIMTSNDILDDMNLIVESGYMNRVFTAATTNLPASDLTGVASLIALPNSKYIQLVYSTAPSHYMRVYENGAWGEYLTIATPIA